MSIFLWSALAGVVFGSWIADDYPALSDTLTRAAVLYLLVHSAWLHRKVRALAISGTPVTTETR